ncbi:fibrillarin-like rRNA/tRNA 2'-O-methyltransferase [Candidatus Woesearchaeota archaeon]|nr:fibrillarin-like rRNA/tRNA 2'-O-methyltransferase [Candidatus Woesearchaeota archaeon]
MKPRNNFSKKPQKSFQKDKSKFDSKPQRSEKQSSHGMMPLGKFPNVFSERKGRFTNYFTKTEDGRSFFDEKIVKIDGQKYRNVNPERSKLFAGIASGISQIGFKDDSVVLYLGASHGYTVSFLSDMIINGQIYAMDFAPRVVRDLIFLCEAKTNIAPFMADANQTAAYSELLPASGVDVIFMDIAQKNQVEIFTKNCDAFLKSGGFGLLALKSRSVDVTKKPKDIFKIVRSELEKKYVVVDYRELDPFEEDHALFVIKKK